MSATILVASTNRHKFREISEILSDFAQNFISLDAFPAVPEALENGTTFRENARIKARHYYLHCQIPVIADDSGLVVPALNGEPGVLSARYAGIGSNYTTNNRLLLERMQELSGEGRQAYFVCAMIYFDGKQEVLSEGRVDGEIITEPRGKGGFGYDPLFLYPALSKTFAELPAEEKNRLSHRYRALIGLKDLLAENP